MKNTIKFLGAFSVLAILLPSAVSAQSVADLQAQIQALLAQLQQLQAQLTQMQGGTAAWCHTFNTNLGVGAAGDEVTAFQTALSREFPQDRNIITGNFDEVTASLVSQFQEKYRSEVLNPLGLSAGTGYLGPSTRAKLNAIYGCQFRLGGLPMPVPTSTVVTGGGGSASTTSATVTSTTTGFCEHAAPRQGCYYQGPDVYPACSATLVCTDNPIPSITVISPNGGEMWQVGTTHQITWSSAAYPANTQVQIIFYDTRYGPSYDVLGTGSIITTIGVGSYALTLPTSAPVGNSYRVRVSVITSSLGLSSDDSNAPFSIVAATSATTSLTVSRNPAVGTQTVTAGAASQKIGSYILSASSAEAVNVSLVNILLGSGGSQFQNLRIWVNGTQFGMTFGTLADNTTYPVSFAGIPFSVPAGGSATIDVYADVLSSATAATRTALTTLSGCQAAGAISRTSLSCASVAGQDVIVIAQPAVAPALTISRNSAFPNQTYIAGIASVKIASFMLTASGAEGATVSSLTFDKDFNPGIDLQNLKVFVGSTQFGATRAVVGDAESGMTFAGTATITVPAGGSVIVDVYADVSMTSASGTHSSVIDLIGWTANGATSLASIPFPGAVDGQDVTIISQATPFAVRTSATNPPGGQVAAGATGVTILNFDVVNTAAEDIRILTIGVPVSGGDFAVVNLQLWQGNSLVVPAAAPGSTRYFNFTTPLIVPRAATITLTLKTDIITLQALPNVVGTMFSASVPANAVTATGLFSNRTAVQSGSATGGTFTIVQSTTTTQPLITVLSPNGGEMWQVGTTHQITWSSAAYPANTQVQIIFYDTRYGPSYDVLGTGSIITTIGVGSYALTLPTSAPVGNSYRVRVSVITSSLGLSSDDSNAPFSIVAAPAPVSCTLSVAYPYGNPLTNNTIRVGETVTFNGSSNPSGYLAYWFGTKNGITDAQGIYAGKTNFGASFGPYQSDSVGNYTRYLQLQDTSGGVVCTTNVLNLTVSALAAQASPSLTQLANVLASMKVILEEMAALIGR